MTDHLRTRHITSAPAFASSYQKEYYILEIDDPSGLPKSIDVAGDYFTALIVWDAKGVSADVISQLARQLIDAGCDYFCTWGGDCERVHDIIDAEWVGDGTTPLGKPGLMTTWHDKDTLDEAVDFAVHHALSMDIPEEEHPSVVAICIGAPHWTAEVERLFLRKVS